ncbi:MAG: AzlC family ABC transporter permease [Lachnospiraceae bacterium]
MPELKYAFPRTIPVFVGYLFLGAAYGILMNVNGYSVLWTFAVSVLVFAGSLQYLGVNMLAAAVNPLVALAMSLMINARHLFYGISMLEKYGQARRYKAYLIFGLTDETFSVVCHEQIPKQLDRDKVYFWITLLDHSYWVLGSVLGAIAGNFITFDTTGLDFALTALFVVIVTDQWKQAEGHVSALIGALASVVCLIIWGADSFIIPAMVMILIILAVNYRRHQKKEAEHGAN